MDIHTFSRHISAVFLWDREITSRALIGWIPGSTIAIDRASQGIGAVVPTVALQVAGQALEADPAEWLSSQQPLVQGVERL